MYLTPETGDVVPWEDRCEAKWTPIEMPFEYNKAPILVGKQAYTDFKGGSVIRFILDNSEERDKNARPRSHLERFTSLFRSRASPLPADFAKEVIDVYERWRESPPAVARTYSKALPYVPPWTKSIHQQYSRFLHISPEGNARQECLMALWQSIDQDLITEFGGSSPLLDGIRRDFPPNCVVKPPPGVPWNEWECFLLKVRWCIYQLRIMGLGGGHGLRREGCEPY